MSDRLEGLSVKISRPPARHYALMVNYYNSRSPFPLPLPVPTPPAYIPKPPSTPASITILCSWRFPHQPSHLALLQNHPHAVPDFSAWGTIDGATAQFGDRKS